MIFLFPKWDMLVPWKVEYFPTIGKSPNLPIGDLPIKVIPKKKHIRIYTWL